MFFLLIYFKVPQMPDIANKITCRCAVMKYFKVPLTCGDKWSMGQRDLT